MTGPKRFHNFLLAAALSISSSVGVAADTPREGPLPKVLEDPGEQLFAGRIPRLFIEISQENYSALRNFPRESVRGSIRDGSHRFENAGIHLKGSRGSFRAIDDKPGFTIDFAQFERGQLFEGLGKIHLNNSVEDPSRLCEWIGSALFRKAGVPAPRITHAIIHLNGRPLGLYVLKEAFTDEWVQQQFSLRGGNLYEPEDGQDVDRRMIRHSGAGPNSQTDLVKLASSAQQTDLDQRWRRLQSILDVEEFLSFMVMEVLLDHRDGYCLAKNNFRLYSPGESGPILFLPHGMDQLFAKADAPINPLMNGLVARALKETPEGGARYHSRFGLLFTNIFVPEKLIAALDVKARELEKALDPPERNRERQEIASLKERIHERHRSVSKQLAELKEERIEFNNDSARLTHWHPDAITEQAHLAIITNAQGQGVLEIRAKGKTSASWRTSLILPRGQYRFVARISTSGVAPLAGGRQEGAHVRVLGQVSEARKEFLGTTGWTETDCEFKVASPEGRVQLLCELTASEGAAWFSLAGLRIERVP